VRSWGSVNATRQAVYREGAEFLFSRPRSDGVLPYMCSGVDGSCLYGTGIFILGNMPCNSTEGAPDWRGCLDLDTAPFAVKLAAHVWDRLESKAARDAWLDKWGDTLERALNATPTSPDGSGLVW
jgi:hypothetical protein